MKALTDLFETHGDRTSDDWLDPARFTKKKNLHVRTCHLLFLSFDARTHKVFFFDRRCANVTVLGS